MREKGMNYVEGIINAIVSENKQVYNPVFFYGEGTQVSSVFDKIEYVYRAVHPNKKLCRIGSKVLANAFVYAIKSESDGNRDNLEGLEKSISNCDLFMIEEYDKVASYGMFSQVFYGLFDSLYEGGSQIVVGANCRPMDMAALEPRVRTQLESGIICYVLDQ